MKARQIQPADSADLRRRVLRGGRDVPLPGDESPAYHVGVFERRVLLGCGNIRISSSFGSETWWRVRGMATEPEHRGRGVGALVLESLLDHARRDRGGGVWLNARLGAVPFYERAGFVVEGDSWDDPEIGPHVMMLRSLEPAHR